MDQLKYLKIELDPSNIENAMPPDEFNQAIDELEATGIERNVRLAVTFKMMLIAMATAQEKLRAEIEDIKDEYVKALVPINDQQIKVLVEVLKPHLPMETIRFLYTELMSSVAATNETVRRTVKQPEKK